ncbi:mitochondrial outer membrane translocase complex, subunit Tom22 [Gautieria morchelliformis]|nr:mitochondrial outer membrane translocase complex, subunit Tom22 [Gautieria morchelliformis]
MVKVEIVDEQETSPNSPYASSASSRTSSSVSLSSVSSDVPAAETLYDRLAALVDIVPPTTRHAISSRVSRTTSFLVRGGKMAGNVAWVVATSALLVGLPLVLVLEDESRIVQQEKEMLAQQQGAQAMMAAPFQPPGGSSSVDPSRPKQQGLVPPGF